MQASITKIEPPESFKPLRVTLILESREELDALYTLTQCCLISDALTKIGFPDVLGAPLYTALRGHGAMSSNGPYIDALRHIVGS